LRIYDVRGALVRNLVDAIEDAGPHSLSWDGKDEHGNAVASGVYFLRMQSGRDAQTRKMVLIK